MRIELCLARREELRFLVILPVSSSNNKKWRQRPWSMSEEVAERRMFRRGLQVLMRKRAARLGPSKLNETNE